MCAASICAGGLYGSGIVCDGEGVPLRPGGLALTEALVDLARFRRGDLVTDIGCGQGASVALMQGQGILAIGVDADPVALASARKTTSTDVFMVADGDRLPFRPGCLDGVLSECSLSVMPNREMALAEWFRVLRPGGRLAMSDVYARAACANLLATEVTITQAVADAGFYIERFEDRSPVLKAWAARFIFQYGSLDALWCGTCGLNADTVRRDVPGYYIMIAIKPGRATGG